MNRQREIQNQLDHTLDRMFQLYKAVSKELDLAKDELQRIYVLTGRPDLSENAARELMEIRGICERGLQK